MQKTRPKFLFLALFIILLVPALALAHQPRTTESRLTQVPDPEISKAYYAKLSGEPDIYVIEASEPFDLYVNVLVPDIAGQKKDVSAVILKDVPPGEDTAGAGQVAFLDGPNFKWEQFYEPFGADIYWVGPEYKARAQAGTYKIRVSSPNNDSKYSLAIGEIEAFDFKESINALTLIPELKKNFFNESPIGFIVSPFGWGLIVMMYLLAFVFGFVLKFVMKKLRKSAASPFAVLAKDGGVHKNIGKGNRLLRFAIGAGLLLWAMATTWSPILIFFSGLCVFDAIFSLRPSKSEEVLRPEGRM